MMVFLFLSESHKYYHNNSVKDLHQDNYQDVVILIILINHHLILLDRLVGQLVSDHPKVRLSVVLWVLCLSLLYYILLLWVSLMYMARHDCCGLYLDLYDQYIMITIKAQEVHAHTVVSSSDQIIQLTMMSLRRHLYLWCSFMMSVLPHLYLL